MGDAVNVRGEIYDVLRELAGRMVDGGTLPQAVMCWLGLPKPIADRLERGHVQQQSATPNLEALTPLGVSRLANAPDDLAAWAVAWLATDAGRAAIRAGVRAELGDLASHFGKAWQSTVGDGRSLRATDIAWILEHFLASAAPREPAQDEPAAGVAQDPPDSGNDPFAAAGAAGFAEGVEAAAEIADGFLVRGPDIAAAIRSMPLPAAPDPLRPGLRAARDAADELRLQGMRLALVEISSGPGDEVERDKHAAAKLRAEIARRGGA